MFVVVNIKMSPKLKKALERFAEQQGFSLSALIRHTMIESLEAHAIYWREEADE